LGKRKFILGALIVWLVCIVSMVGVHLILNKKPSQSDFGAEARAIFQSLETSSQESVSLYESGIIKLEDGTLRIIGSGYQSELQALISENKLDFKKLALKIDNPLILERAMLVGQAFKTLNNAEKQMFARGYASILFQDGTYWLYFSPKIYQKYIARYGIDCRSCDENRVGTQTN
jgi:hypothetical protein